jgi:hypothetical protein
MKGGLVYMKLARLFSRVLKAPKPSFKDKLESKFKVTSPKDNRLLEEEDRVKPDDPSISENTLAKMELKTQILPEK